ncbi:hypothetical protein Ae168Ps1_6385c [Pseudonocardia sp. Ae168_Ps1]|uniref:hypothetical protein n=1 Tax=unclassified Pseudonocardia TaxID=2619320 RepID=UPI00094B0526|nr:MULTISPECIES: hypothetical protein [unclassified Pseudonocardia]OLL69828.1 hypothetical protein Ae150APs1_6239c [Pseudonocardia sp. Ae150A_Ps1]OLL69960.1 hypothetical protein Ae168Ps1_6385c [Pseudonocardia sp. Ae168_Ps1]OLL89121.1 hypothetical protein Ae356Ps1_6238c [Pseudonocardia sp. Ae356_Ps1]
MAERKPLALVNGAPAELAAADTIPTSAWAGPADRRYGHLRARDEEVYGDLYSPVDRTACGLTGNMSAKVITISGIVSPRSVRASRFRFAVNTAGSHSDNPPVGIRVWGGTNLKRLTVLASVQNLSADTFTSRGVKELALSATIAPPAGSYVFAQFYIGSAWKAQPGLAGRTVSDALLNPDGGRRFELWKSNQDSDQSSPMDATSGWASPERATQPWWALAA